MQSQNNSVIAEKKKKSEILNAILLNNYIRWKDYAKRKGTG
ncbi:MAG: hypothetical protein ACK5VA_13200 [Pseudanabaena sp.]